MKKIFALSIILCLFLVAGCQKKSNPISPPDSGNNVSAVSSNYIPIVLVLYTDINYGGTKRCFIGNDNNLLASSNFYNVASSAVVYKGPDYNAYLAANNGQEPTVTLYGDKSFHGAKVVLRVGKYAGLGSFNLNDKVGSLQFLVDTESQRPNSRPESSFNEIHTVLEIYKNTNLSGWHIIILGTTNAEYVNVNDFESTFGINNFGSSYQVLPGPNATEDRGIRLWTDSRYSGNYFDVYSNQRASGNLKYKVLSTQSINN